MSTAVATAETIIRSSPSTHTTQVDIQQQIIMTPASSSTTTTACSSKSSSVTMSCLPHFYASPLTHRFYEATPAGDAFVPSLATVLTHLVSLSPPERGPVTRFHAVKAPDISIKDYLERIQKYFGCSNECFVLSLIYIDRIVKIHEEFTVSILNIHRLLITAVMLAAKFFDDVYYSNAFYARVGGVRTKEINLLEWQFLSLVNYHLYVTPREYDQYLKNVLAAVNAGIQRPLSISAQHNHHTATHDSTIVEFNRHHQIKEMQNDQDDSVEASSQCNHAARGASRSPLMTNRHDSLTFQQPHPSTCTKCPRNSPLLEHLSKHHDSSSSPNCRCLSVEHLTMQKRISDNQIGQNNHNHHYSEGATVSISNSTANGNVDLISGRGNHSHRSKNYASSVSHGPPAQSCVSTTRSCQSSDFRQNSMNSTCSASSTPHKRYRDDFEKPTRNSATGLHQHDKGFYKEGRHSGVHHHFHSFHHHQEALTATTDTMH